MRLAVLVKQIPKGEDLQLVDGRLRRDGVALEVNAYCRRANARAVELAGESGEVVVFTMGPPAAELALREMLACGATRGVHLCDPAFAGSDTLATSRALAAAIAREGPFDLVLCGANSLDADTGQVGPQVAELLGLPFVSAARELEIDGGTSARVRSEIDGGYQLLEVALPAVVSTAERLCAPSKADLEQCAAVEPTRIVRRTTFDLGLRRGEFGEAGSPTRVGTPESHTTVRDRRIVANGQSAVDELVARGAFDTSPAVVDPVPTRRAVDDGSEIWVVLDPDAAQRRRELVGEAARIAAALGGAVVAIVMNDPPEGLGADGADRVVSFLASSVDDWGATVTAMVRARMPRVVLVEGTRTGRAVAARLSARHGWGLTGDGIRIEVGSAGELIVWKPALGGQLVVPITSNSPVQVATIRPGVLPVRPLRDASEPEIERVPNGAPVPARVRIHRTDIVDDGAAGLAGAEVVLAVGQGVRPDDYAELEPLRSLLGASMAATRKVTDEGWMPRSRQVGVTGLSLSPRLLVSIGASGRFNHAVGFSTAAHVFAVNRDPDAEIFGLCDVGVVGDWRSVVPDVVAALPATLTGAVSAERRR